MTTDKGFFSPPIAQNSGPRGDVVLATTSSHGPSELSDLVDVAQHFAANTRAPSTKRAYRSDWRAFTTWCNGHGYRNLPAQPEEVALFVSHLATTGRKVGTISRSLVSISQAHKLQGYPSPTSSVLVAEVMKGIRRTLGVSQKQKVAVEARTLRALVEELGDELLPLRDRALLLIGFAGAFRRSELVGLEVKDLNFTSDGLVITVSRSKTDQEGRGSKIGVPFAGSPITCPVRALRAWLTTANITEGPVFRVVGRWSHVGDRRLSGRAVARVVKKYAASIGLDPKDFGGHSLRSGFATSAARAGKSERSIMAQTGHRSAEMVRRYIRTGTLFADNAASGLL